VIPPLGYVFTDQPAIRIPIIDDQLIEGDETFNMKLFTPANSLILGGEPIPLGTALGLDHAQLTVVDNDFNYGVLGFEKPEYFITENQKLARITVTRVNGSQGDLAIDYETADGSATAPLDYTPTFGTLTFASGQTTNSFIIPIRDDTAAELEETVKLTLLNPTGFPTNVPTYLRLDTNRTTATLTIIDNDFAPGRIGFSQSPVPFSENE